MGIAGAVLVVVVALSFASAGVLYLGASRGGRPGSLADALVLGMSNWLVWPFIIPVIIWLARQFPIGPSKWASGLIAHVTASAALALAAIVVTEALCYLGRVPPGGIGVWDSQPTAVAERFQFGFLVYWVVVASVHAVEYHRRLQQREVEAAHFRAELAFGQLQALRMQMNPHFLFNTLHTISVYVRERRSDEAVDMIANLGDLLRTSLEQGDRQEVSLAEEIEFSKKYLQIEQLRFEDRMRVKIQVPPAIEAAFVPAMILQPIVENAIRHGIASSPSAGYIEIRAWCESDELRLQVRDDGPGFGVPNGRMLGLGLGLSNTKVRLERLYGDGGRMDMKNHDDGGAIVELRIPWHVTPVLTHEAQEQE